ncbi:MAG: ABC transporter permease [Planctomycetaceae bacterium]|nr:ABC transporter permease [Planctomycetaceae bacterium]MBP63410.1 ABC transporter permease [Planctomycetaceae bacterium]
MYLFENAVLQRGLLTNLRMTRGFILLFAYNALLGLVVYIAWPQQERLDLTTNPEAAKQLVNLFFLGQYVLASLMTPSFAAGAITFEKEQKTYEMLLASPMKPRAIVLGKLLSSLTHLAILIFASLPIVMLCLPLGGVSMYEVLAAYLGLIISVVTFGMISIACSSFFKRTASSLVVSYLLILPLALLGIVFWNALAADGKFRLLFTISVVPAVCGVICTALFLKTSARLLRPPDVGSEGNEVIDIEEEAQQAVGLVIQRDQFPDRLFAPAKRSELLRDNANPVYDKEIRSEIFSQGTLMLRLVIQVSMFLAIPLMALYLYIYPDHAGWYIGYVIVFNMLVGPVFSAGTVTSERERETLDLLLTTTITPWQILWGKLIASLRISSILTMFLLWPVLLACVMVSSYWNNLLAVAGYLAIVLLTCLTTAMLALFCSVIFRKTSHSMMTAYLFIIFLFCIPLALLFFTQTFYEAGTPLAELLTISSPLQAASQIPLYMDLVDDTKASGDWFFFIGYVAFSLLLNLGLLVTIIWLFNTRWRVAT